jgi:hypothetical protein
MGFVFIAGFWARGLAANVYAELGMGALLFLVGVVFLLLIAASGHWLACRQGGLRALLRPAGVALLAASVSACTTTPLADHEYRDIAAEGRLSEALLTPAPDRPYAVVIRRDESFVAGGVSVRIDVDGQPAARLRQGERCTVYLSEGRHLLRAGIDSLPAWMTLAPDEVDASVPSGRDVYRVLVLEDHLRIRRSSD